MAHDLVEIEERYGFVFGGGDDRGAGARVLKQIKCETPGCERARLEAPSTPIHEDTQLPVICGGCSTVLHCDHVPGDVRESIDGTLAAPTITRVTTCRACGTVLDSDTEALPPVSVADLPAAALHALGVPFPRGT